jgi:hypothetical protein
MSKRKSVIFRLPADVKKKLQMKVLEEGTSIQELLEDFVYDYLGMREEKMVLESIMKVAQENTDFDIGFDNLFRFMAKNPDSATTRGFIEYHRVEMNDPKTPKGDADFTYLIGMGSIDENWVAAEDLDKFQKFCEAQRRG